MSGPARPRGSSGRSPTHLRPNRRLWDRTAADYERRNAAALRREGGAAWGLFRVPERTLGLLGATRGRRILELGCGAASWSIALARNGARPVGVDFSAGRLRQARAAVAASRRSVPLVQGNAESLPFAAGSFEIVLSDYGATLFADPERWVAEAARVLTPDGTLVFAHFHPLRSLVEDVRSDRLTRRLRRDYFDLGRTYDGTAFVFQRPLAAWFELFARHGFGVERLLEPRAPAAFATPYLGPADRRWATRWPVEILWKLRKGSTPSEPRPLGRAPETVGPRRRGRR